MSINTRYYKGLRLTPPANCSGAQDLGSGCRWALKRRLLAAVSADLTFMTDWNMYDTLSESKIKIAKNNYQVLINIHRPRVSHITYYWCIYL